MKCNSIACTCFFAFELSFWIRTVFLFTGRLLVTEKTSAVSLANLLLCKNLFWSIQVFFGTASSQLNSLNFKSKQILSDFRRTRVVTWESCWLLLLHTKATLKKYLMIFAAYALTPVALSVLRKDKKFTIRNHLPPRCLLTTSNRNIIFW